MIKFEDDIKFLCKRFKEQEEYISNLYSIHFLEAIPVRSKQLIQSAYHQRRYFRNKITEWVKKNYPIGMTVKFTDSTFGHEGWPIGEVRFSNECVCIVSAYDTASINAPYGYVEDFLQSLKVIT